jgi:acetyl-CoA carboxylase/biotin carboxylase 1
VERLADDVYRLTLGNNQIEARVTETAEGALLATFGGETHRIFGMDEPLGLRLVLDGNTILMPTIFDPSELRTDVTGKVVRYLKENGQEIQAGEPYVEVEAMKMIMPIKATETGKITNALSPGSVINAGDLLASLELKDPSKVKKIETFEGKLSIPSTPLDHEVAQDIKNILAGYDGNPDALVQAAFESMEDIDTASQLVIDTVEEFLRVEEIFIGKLMDDVVRELTKANIDNLEKVVSEIFAHQQLQRRSALVLAMLRQVENFSFRFAQPLPADLLAAVEKLAALSGKEYGSLVVAADMIIRESKVPSFESRVEELRSQFLDTSTDLDALARSTTLSAGVDLLTYLFSDEDPNVRSTAAEVYVRRLYRAHRMISVQVGEKDGRLTCNFQFQYAEVEESQSVTQNGLLEVVPDVASLKSLLPDILNDLSATIGDKPTTVGDVPINTLHLVTQEIGQSLSDTKVVEDILATQDSQLKRLGVRLVNLCVPRGKKRSCILHFPRNLQLQRGPSAS